MLRYLAVACILLMLTAPTVAADPGAASEGTSILECLKTEPGAVNVVQCFLNTSIDAAERVLQNAIRDACILLFGEPC